MKILAIEKLNKFYSQFSSSDHVLVLITADPDAIASAMAVKRLLWRKVYCVNIAHTNIIKRPDNLAMIRLLGVKLVHINEINRQDFTKFVIVDSQPNHSELFNDFLPQVVIDHHPDTDFEAPFIDVRAEYGATASILTEYLRAAKIKPSAKLATGLFYAIKTDTNNFARKTISEDIRAFQFVFQHTNVHLAKKIEQADLRFDFLKYFKIAFENIKIHKKKVFIHLGEVMNPDVCVLIADFFMRVQSVQWAIVSGVCESKLVVIFRNDGLCMNAGKLAKKSFGCLGSAGGHKSMARAEIFLSNLDKCVNYNKSTKKNKQNKQDSKVALWIIDRIESKKSKISKQIEPKTCC